MGIGDFTSGLVGLALLPVLAYKVFMSIRRQEPDILFGDPLQSTTYQPFPIRRSLISFRTVSIPGCEETNTLSKRCL